MFELLNFFWPQIIYKYFKKLEKIVQIIFFYRNHTFIESSFKGTNFVYFEQYLMATKSLMIAYLYDKLSN